MFQSLDLFVLSFLFVVVEPQEGQVLKKQNVTLQWISGFQPQLSWAPVEGCTYDGWHNGHPKRNNLQSLWQPYIIMEGGRVKLSVLTECNGTEIEPVEFPINNPVLVSKLQCYIHAPKKTHCSWLPAPEAQDVKFFYRLLKEDFTSGNNDPPAAEIKDSIRECPFYTPTDGSRTGCDLEAGVSHSVDILFNGTVNNKLAWNTFKKLPRNNVRPPPLEWTVTKNGDKFNIRWTHPNIQASWKFLINYTECQQSWISTYPNETKSAELNVVPKCPYCIAVKAEKEFGGGETPWSEPKCFGAETEPYLYAAIIIPLVCAGVAVLGFVYCRKNKKTIFPKVPKPRDLISDISDNNNKCNVHNLYVPAKEEDSCKITLVVDPQMNN